MTMKLLITSATKRLPARLAQDLAATHDLRLTALAADPNVPGLVVSDLAHDSATDDLVRGIDAIVHWGGTDPAESASDRLDQAMYSTYNLLRSASSAGVSRVVYLSSLDLFEKYPEEYTVTEQWRPEPTTSVDDLSYHLGEYVCREFAREQRLAVVCLRLGDLVWGGRPTSSSSLLVQDAVQAVELALDSNVSDDFRWTLLPDPFEWQLYHVQSNVRGARFATITAQTRLGFEPAREVAR
jgi:uronate dehydrogenase